MRKLKLPRIKLPSPLFMATQFFKAPYLSLWDLIRAIPFACHLLAFDSDKDYLDYDRFSFNELCERLKVSAPFKTILLDSFVLSACFTDPANASAAAVLSAFQFYVVRDQDSVLTRWSNGLPADRIFDPLAEAIAHEGGSVDLNSAAQGIQIVEGK